MIVRVEGVDDPRLEAFSHIGDHRWLRKHGLFAAEGRLVVERLIAARSYAIHSVLVSPSAHAALESSLRGLESPVYVAPQAAFSDLAGFNFHRGCLALAARPAPLGLDALAGTRLLLGLEGIGNPDNVGGLFRTAAAFGVDAVVLDDATGDPLYRKAVRTSMGAVLTMPFVRVSGWVDAIAALRADGLTVAALTPAPDALTLDEYAARGIASERLLLIVGSEGPGLSAAVLEHADARVRIPMAGSQDSLNVTVAAGVALSRFRKS